MNEGEWGTRITAWIAFAAWFAALAINQTPPSRPPRDGAAVIWLLGSVVMGLHTVLAFHVYHAWSHTAAVVDTAQRTRELTGLDWGGGVWLNYLFAIGWLSDAAWRIAAPRAHARRPRSLAVVTHAFLGFIWFNATVVFGSWPMRAAGMLVFLILAGRAGRRPSWGIRR